MCDEDTLVELLGNITEKEFESFKWNLKKVNHDGKKPITVSELEGKNREMVVDLMVQKYELGGAGTVMVTLLTKINRNDLVKQMKDTSPATVAEATAANVSAKADERLMAVRSKFVEKVSTAVLQQLLDRMLENRILNDGEIDLDGNKASQARQVIDMVRNKGPKPSQTFIVALCDLDPCLAEQLNLK